MSQSSTASPTRPAGPVPTVPALLAAHVPLSLLLDLAQPTGPRSRELLAGEPADTTWVR